MQSQIAEEEWPVEVRLLGVNGIGHESGNEQTCEGRSLPWLQDVPDEDVWTSWQISYRDVVILDGMNVPVTVYNLTEHDLGNPANYAELKSILRVAAEGN